MLVKRLLMAIDEFADDHLPIDHGVDEEQVNGNKEVMKAANDIETKTRVLGGLATIGSVITCLMLLGEIVYMFIFYNVGLNQSLVPADDAITVGITTDLLLKANLYSFSGCNGSESV